MSYAREIGFAIKQASEDQETREKLCEGLGISKQELERLYAGRSFLTGVDLDMAAGICGIPAEVLVGAVPVGYDSRVVDCMTAFKNRENREEILDLIDTYIDAKEALATAEKTETA